MCRVLPPLLALQPGVKTRPACSSRRLSASSWRRRVAALRGEWESEKQQLAAARQREVEAVRQQYEVNQVGGTDSCLCSSACTDPDVIPHSEQPAVCLLLCATAA